MEIVLAIFLFAIASTITPGPNNIMIMTSGVNHGVRSSVPHLLGICFGFPFMVVLVGVGLSTIFIQYPSLHEVIKILGVGYLLYLAAIIALSEPGSVEGSASRPLSFMQAVIFQWVNPKAWVMATSAVAAFTSPAANIYIQVLLIGFAFFIAAFPCVGSWLIFGAGLRRYLHRSNHLKVFNVSMATLLAISVLPVIADWVGTYSS